MLRSLPLQIGNADLMAAVLAEQGFITERPTGRQELAQPGKHRCWDAFASPRWSTVDCELMWMLPRNLLDKQQVPGALQI